MSRFVRLLRALGTADLAGQERSAVALLGYARRADHPWSQPSSRARAVSAAGPMSHRETVDDCGE